MDTIYFATSNIGKFNSLRREFVDYHVNIEQLFTVLPESRSLNVEEIAKEKIEYAYKSVHKPVVVSDAGFYIMSIKGFPGTFVNFALETIGIEGLLKLVECKSRDCEFRECLAYLDERLAQPLLFIGVVKGRLADKPRGEMQPHLWSELGLVFIPEGSDKTLAEMDHDTYSKWRSISREKTSPARLFFDWYLKNRLSIVTDSAPAG